MKAKISLIIIASSLFIFSCKKDKDIAPVNNTAPTQTNTTSYLKLGVGNYWIYSHYTQDSLGNDTPTNEYDSLYISKDSVINGKTCYYFIHSCHNPIIFETPTYWVTDSSSFLLSIPTSATTYSINQLDVPHILLDPIHITDTTNVFVRQTTITPPLTYTTYTIPKTFANCVVPAGVYSGSSFHRSIILFNGANTYHDNNQIIINYVANIGICYIRNADFVSQVYAHTADVWKLERYHIQ